MSGFNASRRESVWFETEIRKAAAFEAIGAIAFGLWTRLPFLVDGDHTLPELAVMAQDTELAETQLLRLMTELVTAGFVSLSPDGQYHMTPLSQRYYALSEPQNDEEADGEGDEAHS